MCGCCNEVTSDIKYDGDKLVCPNDPDFIIFECDKMNTVIRKLFEAACSLKVTAFNNTKIAYNTTASYPVAGGNGTLTIPSDGDYYVTGNVTCEVPDGSNITSAILLAGAAISVTEKTMNNASGSTLHMNISFIYKGTFAQNNVIQIGVKDVGPAASVVQSEIYYQKVGG